MRDGGWQEGMSCEMMLGRKAPYGMPVQSRSIPACMRLRVLLKCRRRGKTARKTRGMQANTKRLLSDGGRRTGPVECSLSREQGQPSADGAVYVGHEGVAYVLCPWMK